MSHILRAVVVFVVCDIHIVVEEILDNHGYCSLLIAYSSYDTKVA